jgi:hypothetical protein
MLRRLDPPACLYNQLEKKTDQCTDPFGNCTTATQLYGNSQKNFKKDNENVPQLHNSMGIAKNNFKKDNVHSTMSKKLKTY